MFEFDAGKLIIIGIVALIVIGPKELPRVMRHLGQALAKMRRMAAEFRGQFLEAMRESEIEELRSGVETLTDSTKRDLPRDPFAQLKAELTDALAAAEKPNSPSDTGVPSGPATQSEGTPADAVTPSVMADAPQLRGPVETGAGTGAAAREPTPSAAPETNAKMQAFAGALSAEMMDIAPDPLSAAKAQGNR